jgi:hypothetical protein
MKTIQFILDWSEVWSPLIPLAFFIFLRPKAKWVKPIFYFLIVTLIFSIALDVIWKRRSLGLYEWFQKNLWWWYELDPATGKQAFKNSIFYNLNSLARLIFFSMFFTYFYPVFKKMHQFVPWIFLLLSAINFIWFENIKDFSSRQHAVEAAILLYCCMLFFYKRTMDENIAAPASLPEFRVVTGLTLYTAINFFIFLFYKYLMTSIEFKDYAQEVWNVHNISFIILNIFIASAFFKAKKNE